MLLHVAIMLLPLVAMQAKPVPVPPWAVSMLKDPPPVSPEIVSEVDDLWAVMQEHSSNRDTGFLPDTEYVRAATRFIQLKEQAGQAMVWQYFKEPPDKQNVPPGPAPDSYELQGLARYKGHFRFELLRVLSYDPDLARWYLPLLRDRLKWAENEIHNGKFLESISYSELGAIQIYLYYQGTMTDIESFDHLINMAVDAGIYQRADGFETPLNEQMHFVTDAKANLRRHAKPFWQTIALDLADHGWFDKKTLEKPHYIFPDLDLHLQSPAPQTVQTWRAKDSETQTVASQVILVGLAFLASLLLALVFKKRRDPV